MFLTWIFSEATEYGGWKLYCVSPLFPLTCPPPTLSPTRGPSHLQFPGLLMVALRCQGNWWWEGPLGTPLGLVHWKRASSPVEAGTAGYL